MTKCIYCEQDIEGVPGAVCESCNEAWDAACEWEADQVFCSICDGLGHGQPGHGPCPLEERGAYEPEEEYGYA